MSEKIRGQNHKSSSSEKEGVMVFEKEKIETGIKAQTVMALAKGIENGEQDQYRVEMIVSNSPELTPELLQEISDFFRYTFNNAFPEYVVCTDCDVSIFASEVFETQGKYVPLDQLDNNENLPSCPDCNKQMNFFHDGDMTLRKLEQKFQQEGRIVLILSEETNEIKGMTFGYYDSLENVIEKEWGHPYNYMKEEDQKKEQKFDVGKALEKINTTEREIDAQTEVCCWNCIMLNPEVLGNVNLLVRKFLDPLPKTDLPVVAQVISGSIIHSLLRRRGYREVEDVFPKEYRFMIGELDRVKRHYLNTIK